MQDLLTTSNITFALGIIAIVFTIYRYFKDPQTDDEKQAALLGQRVQFMYENFEARYKSMQDNFNSLLLQSNNHIHTLDVKIDKLACETTDLVKEVTKLQTIIDERIPKTTT
jgi:hypothetical protein